MIRLLIISAATAFASCLILPDLARADDDGETSQMYASMAVQNRLYTQTGELSAFVGFLPMDAFTKGLTLSGAYTHHFTDHWAWEIGHFFYSFHIDTDLRKDLREEFELRPTPFEVIDYMVTSNGVFKPVYWKGTVFNDWLIYGEFLILQGVGFAKFTRSERIIIDLGIAMRIYVSTLFSFRLDVRYHTYFEDTIFKDLKFDHEIWTGLGTSISF